MVCFMRAGKLGRKARRFRMPTIMRRNASNGDSEGVFKVHQQGLNRGVDAQSNIRAGAMLGPHQK